MPTIIGIAVFILGVILTAVSLTVAPSSNLLLIGLIVGGAGFAIMWLFRGH